MSNIIDIIDYGIGNILSVSRGVIKCGAEPRLIKTPEAVIKSTHLILPGVGAFKRGMENLRSQNLIEAIHEYSKTGKPLLGICLGMQMMLTESEEFGLYQGLNLIPGKVKKIPEKNNDGLSHKLPHIGWNVMYSPKNQSWKNRYFHNVEQNVSAYFVHSYSAHCDNPSDTLAFTNYNGLDLTAAIQKENTLGCQFHPEKSGPLGLKILTNFVTR